MRSAAAQNEHGTLITSESVPSHFNMVEFACRCGSCGPWRVDVALVDSLERLRTLGGWPIKILSGLRCADHNRRVGGATASQHLPDESGVGGAADIQFYVAGRGRPPLSSVEAYLLSLQLPRIGGRGLASNYVHLDTRAEPAEWMYNGSGKTPMAFICDLVVPHL